MLPLKNPQSSQMDQLMESEDIHMECTGEERPLVSLPAISNIGPSASHLLTNLIVNKFELQFYNIMSFMSQAVNFWSIPRDSTNANLRETVKDNRHQIHFSCFYSNFIHVSQGHVLHPHSYTASFYHSEALKHLKKLIQVTKYREKPFSCLCQDSNSYSHRWKVVAPTSVVKKGTSLS